LTQHLVDFTSQSLFTETNSLTHTNLIWTFCNWVLAHMHFLYYFLFKAQKLNFKLISIFE